MPGRGRMGDRLVGVEPGDADVAPRHRPAGQDQPIHAFGIGQREFGVGRQLDLAAFEPRLAGAAIAGAAAMRIGHTVPQRRLEDGLAELDRNRRTVLTNRGEDAHPRCLSRPESPKTIGESNCSCCQRLLTMCARCQRTKEKRPVRGDDRAPGSAVWGNPIGRGTNRAVGRRGRRPLLYGLGGALRHPSQCRIRISSLCSPHGGGQPRRTGCGMPPPLAQ